MSLKSTLLRVGGYSTMFIPGVNAFSPMIIAGTEAAANALDNNEAAKKAAGQLQEGNQQATDIYAKSFAPYTNLGSQAANTLGWLMGFSPAGGQPMPTQAAPAPVEAASTRVRSPEAPVTGQAFPRGTLASMAQLPTQSSYAKVRMRAPDGEEADVPQERVKHFLDRGGMVVA